MCIILLLNVSVTTTCASSSTVRRKIPCLSWRKENPFLSLRHMRILIRNLSLWCYRKTCSTVTGSSASFYLLVDNISSMWKLYTSVSSTSSFSSKIMPVRLDVCCGHHGTPYKYKDYVRLPRLKWYKPSILFASRLHLTSYIIPSSTCSHRRTRWSVIYTVLTYHTGLLYSLYVLDWKDRCGKLITLI